MMLAQPAQSIAWTSSSSAPFSSSPRSTTSSNALAASASAAAPTSTPEPSYSYWLALGVAFSITIFLLAMGSSRSGCRDHDLPTIIGRPLGSSAPPISLESSANRAANHAASHAANLPPNLDQRTVAPICRQLSAKSCTTFPRIVKKFLLRTERKDKE